ncbi:MAG: phosphatidate cytidylyltransferase [Bacteroidia bacterium]|nr:phosphatidate cytidylyltransferase [Bacteroidia bacterium]
MSEFRTRTVWGFLFVTAILGAILLGSYTFALLFLILSVLVLREFYFLCRMAGFSPQIYPGLAAGAAIFSLSFFTAQHSITFKAFNYLLPFIYAFPVYELFRKKENPLMNIALTGFGIIFVTIPFSMLNFLAFPEFEGFKVYNFGLLISLFVFVWAGDSGAYIFGVRFGRHRLFERISPKKSWEGLFGGVITAIAAAWILNFIFPQFNIVLLIVMAIVVVISGTLGDLVESMIKRSIGVKDSGRFMPGHGGLLDRFDSILLASPVIYFVFQFFR